MKKIILTILLIVGAVLLFGFLSPVLSNNDQTPSTTLFINSTNTAVTVIDSDGDLVRNNSSLIYGDRYKISVLPNVDYQLETLTLNKVNISNKLVGNAYTFTCSGDVYIDAVSIPFSKKLVIDAVNTVVSVVDDKGVFVENYSDLQKGITYTITVNPSADNFELTTLIFNNKDILSELGNGNTYSFVCAGGVEIKAISVEQEVERFTYTYLGSICTQSTLFGVGGVTTCNMLIYDENSNLLATLYAGDTYSNIEYGKSYKISYERLGGSGFSWLCYALPNSITFQPGEYRNMTIIEHATSDLDFRVEYFGVKNSTTYVGDSVSFTNSVGEEVYEFVVGESYTINDLTDADFFPIVKINNAIVDRFPHTFTLTNSTTIDVEIVEESFVFNVTSNVEGYTFKVMGQEYASGDKIDFSKNAYFFIIPPAGFVLYCVSCPGVASEYFLNGIGSHSYFPPFLKVPGVYDVTLTFATLASNSVSGDVSSYFVLSGTSEKCTKLYKDVVYNFSCTPLEGYEIVGATYNGTVFDATKKFTFTAAATNEFVIDTQPIVVEPDTVTPTITLSGYTGDLADIGTVKFRQYQSSLDYVVDNLVVGDSYEMSISTFSSSYYYVSEVFINGESVFTNSDSTASSFAFNVTITDPMSILLVLTRK